VSCHELIYAAITEKNAKAEVVGSGLEITLRVIRGRTNTKASRDDPSQLTDHHQEATLEATNTCIFQPILHLPEQEST